MEVPKTPLQWKSSLLVLGAGHVGNVEGPCATCQNSRELLPQVPLGPSEGIGKPGTANVSLIGLSLGVTRLSPQHLGY